MVQDRTKLNELERNGTKRNETERNGTERNGTVRNGTERNGTEREGMEREGTKREGTKGDVVERNRTWRIEEELNKVPKLSVGVKKGNRKLIPPKFLETEIFSDRNFPTLEKSHFTPTDFQNSKKVSLDIV